MKSFEEAGEPFWNQEYDIDVQKRCINLSFVVAYDL